MMAGLERPTVGRIKLGSPGARGSTDDPLNALNSLKQPDDAETGAIIGAAIHVHKALGSGFLEAVYQAALTVEFRRRAIPFQREARLPVWYDGQWLEDVHYRVDFLCNNILVELKALDLLTRTEFSQVINYLHAQGGGRALLMNFGAAELQVRRFVV